MTSLARPDASRAPQVGRSPLRRTAVRSPYIGRAGISRLGAGGPRPVGFTLIEVMVVVLILGILAAVIVPNVVGRAHDARVAAAKQDIATLSQALAMYKLDNGRLPSAEQGLRALVEKPTLAPVPPNWRSGGYVPRLPNDPWGQPYQYASPGLRGEFDVWSFGADGKTGGEGEGADIGTWNL